MTYGKNANHSVAKSAKRAKDAKKETERSLLPFLGDLGGLGGLGELGVGVFRGESVEHVDEVEMLIAISHVKHAAEEGVTRARLEEMRQGIERDIRKFRELLEGPPSLTQHQPASTARRAPLEAGFCTYPA